MKSNSFWSLLINPFTRLGGWKAFFIGLAILLITTAVGYFYEVAPIGLLYIGLVEDPQLSTILICQLLVLAVFMAVTYIVALVSTKNVRFQDILGVTTLSQSPILLLVLGTLPIKGIVEAAINFMKDGDSTALNQLQSVGSYVFILCVAIALVAILIWYILILYNGFRTLTDLKGGKSIFIFIVVLILCDVLSSYLICLLTDGTVNRFAFL